MTSISFGIRCDADNPQCYVVKAIDYVKEEFTAQSVKYPHYPDDLTQQVFRRHIWLTIGTLNHDGPIMKHISKCGVLMKINIMQLYKIKN